LQEKICAKKKMFCRYIKTKIFLTSGNMFAGVCIGTPKTGKNSLKQVFGFAVFARWFVIIGSQKNFTLL